MAPSGNSAAPALDAALREGQLAGDWTLDPSRSQVRLRSKSMWGMASVKGVFGQVSGHGTVSPAGDRYAWISGARLHVAVPADDASRAALERLASEPAWRPWCDAVAVLT